MDTRATTIRRAGPADAHQVTTLLAAAFTDTTVARWLLPHGALRRHAAPRYFTQQVDHCLSEGWIDLVDGAGAAMWLPQPGVFPPDIDLDQLIATVGGDTAKRLQLLDEALYPHRPTVVHHYLAYIGVTPTCQGQGVGTALLTHHHTNLDNARMTAYLEANDPRNRELYQRLGYSCHPRLDIADGAPPVWPMLRYPAHSA